MRPIELEIPVSFRYAVHFTRGAFEAENRLLADIIATAVRAGPAKALAVVDAGVAAAAPWLCDRIERYCASHASAVALAGPPLVVPGGEAVKNAGHWVEAVQARIDAGGICRHSFVIAIGGGAVLDAVGFAAATAHRGVRLIRVPTTVLAQDDAGIGVKNAVNAFGKKNFVGCFAPPFAVINDFDFLSLLGQTDWRAGMAEAVKVALIRDRDFFTFIGNAAAALAARDASAMERLVYRCAELHLQHIAHGGDPFETGSSRPLDFGHWAAHKLEQLTCHRLRHGEAVAIGLALDSTYSHLLGWLSPAEWQEVLGTLKRLGFALCVDELVEGARDGSLFRGLDEFREHLGGQLTITLLRAIGDAVDVHEVDRGLYREAVSVLSTAN